VNNEIVVGTQEYGGGFDTENEVDGNKNALVDGFWINDDNVVEYSTESKPDRLKDLQTFTETALNKEEPVTEYSFTTTSTMTSKYLNLSLAQLSLSLSETSK